MEKGERMMDWTGMLAVLIFLFVVALVIYEMESFLKHQQRDRRARVLGAIIKSKHDSHHFYSKIAWSMPPWQEGYSYYGKPLSQKRYQWMVNGCRQRARQERLTLPDRLKELEKEHGL